MIELFPSLPNTNLATLTKIVQELDPYCAGYHADLMDGIFVPNTCLSIETINTLAALTTKQVWVHLMVENPLAALATLELSSGSIVSFHIETKTSATGIKNVLKEKKLNCSIAISPKTPVAKLLPLIDQDVYQVLVMSVEPGYSGQNMIPQTLNKLKELAQFRSKHNLPFKLALDGGINQETIAQAVHCGAQQLAIGSALFNANNYIQAITHLHNRANG